MKWIIPFLAVVCVTLAMPKKESNIGYYWTEAGDTSDSYNKWMKNLTKDLKCSIKQGREHSAHIFIQVSFIHICGEHQCWPNPVLRCKLAPFKRVWQPLFLNHAYFL